MSLAASALLLSFAVSAPAQAAPTTAQALADYLKTRILTIDKKRPARIETSGVGQTGKVAELEIAGAPVMMKDVRAEKVAVHAIDLQVDHSKLIAADRDLLVKGVSKFYMYAEVTAQALTDRVNAGKNTEELQATVSFAEGKAHIRGNFKYSFIKGNFEAQLMPQIQNSNQIIFVLEKLKVGGIPAPASIRKILQRKMSPLDMRELVGAPRVDRVWIEGNTLRLLSGKAF